MNFTKWMAVAAIALCGAACSESEDEPVVNDGKTVIPGTYSGYTLASCSYFSDMYAGEQTLTISATESGDLSLSYVSDTWGTFEVASLTTAAASGGYAFEGAGSVAMGMGASTNEYAFTVAGTVDASKSDYTISFDIPGVMGGLTIVMLPGYAPAETVLPGTYNGYTSASCQYFSDSYTDDESLTIAASDGTLTLSYVSATWGTFEAASLTASQKNGSYSFDGAGTVAMGMGESTNEYAFTVTGTVDAAKSGYSISFSVPAVMGGLTIVMQPGSAPETEE